MKDVLSPNFSSPYRLIVWSYLPQDPATEEWPDESCQFPSEMVHKSLTYQVQNLILECLTFKNPTPARHTPPSLNHLPANPPSRQKLQSPFYTGTSQKKIWESREQGKEAGERGDLGQGRMFDKQKSWQALCLASELCVTLGVTSKKTLIRMSSGKGGCEQTEECIPCDHVCSPTNCS